MYNPSKYNLENYNFTIALNPKGSGYSLLNDPTLFNIYIKQNTRTKTSLIDKGILFKLKQYITLKSFLIKLFAHKLIFFFK